MKAVFIGAAGVIIGWLILWYALERSSEMRFLWTAETSLLVFMCFALLGVFIYAMVKLAGRRY